MSFRKALLVISTLTVAFSSIAAMAAEGAASGTGSPYTQLGGALGIGLAAFGGALGQGKTAAAALEGIARNPAADGKIRTPMIICLALIESLVLYAFVIAFLGLSK